MKEEKNKGLNGRQLRKKAEERLRKQQKRNGASLPHILNPERLIHELQVHQIELELQNEELQKAWERAETALKKYTIFFDFAPVAYFMLDREGNIRELNFAAAHLLGRGRLKLLGSNFRIFICESSRAAFNEFYQEVYTSFSRGSCDITLINSNESSLIVHLEGVVIGDDDNCFLAVLNLDAFPGQ